MKIGMDKVSIFSDSCLPSTYYICAQFPTIHMQTLKAGTNVTLFPNYNLTEINFALFFVSTNVAYKESIF